MFSFIGHNKDAGLREENLVPFIQKRSKRDALEKRTFAKSASINSNEMLMQAFKCMCLQFKDKPFMFILRQWDYLVWMWSDRSLGKIILGLISIYSVNQLRVQPEGCQTFYSYLMHFFSCLYKSDEGKK